MNKLHVRRIGFALGSSCAIFYFACAFVMATVPKGAVVRFFNSLLHGIDIEPIMRWDIPLGETIIGALETFILAWLFAALVATLYNLRAPKEAVIG